MTGTTVDSFWKYLESIGLDHIYNSAFESGSARQAFLIRQDSANWINHMPSFRLSNVRIKQMDDAKAGWLEIIGTKPDAAEDNVNHPSHYTSHPSGVEVIQITEHMGFCLGNAIKYILRCDEKHDAIEDLKKAVWYLEREIAKREE